MRPLCLLALVLELSVIFVMASYVHIHSREYTAAVRAHLRAPSPETAAQRERVRSLVHQRTVTTTLAVFLPLAALTWWADRRHARHPDPQPRE